MHIYSKEIVLAASVVLLIGCAPLPVDGSANGCSKDRECTVTGDMYVYRGVPGSVAEIRTREGCIAVALPQEDYVRYQKRRGLRVRVTGIAYNQGAAEGVVSFRLRDREVATGICSSALVIYATKVDPIKR